MHPLARSAIPRATEDDEITVIRPPPPMPKSTGFVVGGAPARPPLLAPVFPDRRALDVRAEAGLVTVSLSVTSPRGAAPLVVTWHRPTGEVCAAWAGTPFAVGRWQNHRVVGLLSVDGGRVRAADSPPQFDAALLEVEIALAKAERDPVLMMQAGAHVVELVALGAMPNDADDALTRGQIAQEIGDAHEHLATRMVRKGLASTPWVRGIRRATLDEDRRGLDVIVETIDAGDLYVQVKSSAAAVGAYRRKYATAPCYPRTVIMLIVTGREQDTMPGSIAKELRKLYRTMGGMLPDSPPKQTAPPFVVPKTSLPGDGKLSQANARKRALAAGDLSEFAGHSPKYVADLIEAQKIALERDRLKTERCRLTEEGRASKEALNLALVLLGRRTDDQEVLAFLNMMREKWPYLLYVLEKSS